MTQASMDRARASDSHSGQFPEAVCPHVSLVTPTETFWKEDQIALHQDMLIQTDREAGVALVNIHWNEMSSPVVCCPVTVKLKLEELRVAKRLSHCCGKNLHNWRPQASSAESVSIQDWVIFSAISSFQPKWSTAFSLHFQSERLQYSQFWGRAGLMWVQGRAELRDKSGKKASCQHRGCGQLQGQAGKDSGR